MTEMIGDDTIDNDSLVRSTPKNHFIFEDGIADTGTQVDETYDNDIVTTFLALMLYL
jgi:hypothetical protein